MDWCESTRHGIKFEETVKIDKEEKKIFYDIKSLKKAFSGEFDMLDTKIVRLGIYPNKRDNKKVVFS